MDKHAVLQGNHEDYIKYKQEYDKIKDNLKSLMRQLILRLIHLKLRTKN